MTNFYDYPFLYRHPGAGRALVKGDHMPLIDREVAYQFVNPQRLMADFMADVKGVGE